MNLLTTNKKRTPLLARIGIGRRFKPRPGFMKKRKYYDYYCKLTLAELRRRQRINAAQTVEAYRLAQEPGTRDRGMRGLIRLQRVARILAKAVYDK